MITYGLGTISYPLKEEQSLPETPAANINIAISLSIEEYNKLLNASAKIGGIYRYADMFSMTRWNYDDLINTIKMYLQAFVKKDINYLTARDISLNINKDLLNLLTSFRFYLDYMDKHLSDDFGKRSEIVSKFGTYCSSEYDQNLSYRLIYHLRNYAQHKGFVVNSINFGKFQDKDNQLQIRHYLKINIGRNDLLDDKGFKKQLRDEIRNLPEKIDVIEHISKWMNSLVKIHNQIIHEIIPTGLKDANFIQSYVDKLSYDPNDERVTPTIFVTDHAEEDIKKINDISHVPLPIKNAQRIVEYCQVKKDGSRRI